MVKLTLSGSSVLRHDDTMNMSLLVTPEECEIPDPHGHKFWLKDLAPANIIVKSVEFDTIQALRSRLKDRAPLPCNTKVKVRESLLSSRQEIKLTLSLTETSVRTM